MSFLAAQLQMAAANDSVGVSLCYMYRVFLEEVAELTRAGNEVIVTKAQCWGCIMRQY
jgi:hypothetical protein